MRSNVNTWSAFIERNTTKTFTMVLEVLRLLFYISLIFNHGLSSSIKHHISFSTKAPSYENLTYCSQETGITTSVSSNISTNRSGDCVQVIHITTVFKSKDNISEDLSNEKWDGLIVQRLLTKRLIEIMSNRQLNSMQIIQTDSYHKINLVNINNRNNYSSLSQIQMNYIKPDSRSRILNRSSRGIIDFPGRLTTIFLTA